MNTKTNRRVTTHHFSLHEYLFLELSASLNLKRLSLLKNWKKFAPDKKCARGIISPLPVH